MKIPLKKDIVSVARKYKLKVFVMFGSNVDGGIHKESDLDLGFYSLNKVNEEKLFKDVVRLFHRGDIDLVNLYKNHSPILRYKILHSGKVLFEAKKGLKNKMEWESYFDYMDFKRYYDERSKLLNKKILGLT